MKNIFSGRLSAKLSLPFLILTLSACGGRLKEAEDNSLRAQQCKPVEKAQSQEEFVYPGKNGVKTLSFSEIRDGINSACRSCHLAPASSGGFSYSDSYESEEKVVEGKIQTYPGFSEIAEKVVSYINHNDEQKRMPPKERREKNPDAFLNLAKNISLWIEAGKPKTSFTVGGPNSIDPNKREKSRRDELGDCTPQPEIIGFDYKKDRFFEKLTSLPTDLADTDLNTLDNWELAKRGTLSYNVEYPLWADNADKGRWIHLPYKIENGKLLKQKIKFSTDKKSFEIPDNTRFYKNFYKKVVDKSGKTRFRRIETRIIVVRKPWTKSLFGTYKWDELEQSATLVTIPYRDGTGFKDHQFEVVVDESTLKTRQYAIPGSQRCIDCHSGSERNDFVLGFTPLQLNRRSIGEAGRDIETKISEKSQVARFINYDLFDSPPALNEWPKLEDASTNTPRNEFELRAQGYMVGNCAHCHNPSGVALNKENGITLQLTAGQIFGFNTKTRSVQIPSRSIVSHDGDLEQSHIWRKVADSSQQLGMTSQMPMSTPGSPDCNVLRVIGKWVKSFESSEAAEQWEPNCKKENEFKWIDQDFTVSLTENYIPRRNDWAQPDGMPEKYRNLEISTSLSSLFQSEIPVGYWNKKNECTFPEKSLTQDEIRPWMLRAGKPKRPFGEIYYSTPGSWFYRTSCMKCHGEKADGNSALARGILNWSGGSVRVANFMGGMFGKNLENLKTFDLAGKNLSAQYLVWMAMEGTKVQFPPELSGYLGRHGGQMLNQMREKCINQISPEKPSSPNFVDHEIFNKICFADNLSADDPNLKYDEGTNAPLNPQAVEVWADRAAFNVGFSIFEFLKEAGGGTWRPGNEECEKVYGNK